MRIRGSVRFTTVILSGLIFLSGCTTADVVTPTAAFADATLKAETALRERQAEIDRAILAYSLAAATEPGASPIRPLPGDCVQTAQRCRLVTKIGVVDWPVSGGAIQHGVLELMGQLTAYTLNLAAIARSQTPAEVETALGETESRVGKLAKAVDDLNALMKLPPTGFQAGATRLGPFIDLAAFGLRQYLEQRKRQAMIAAVDEMTPLFDQMIATFEAVERDGSFIQKAALDTRFVEAQDANRRAPTNSATAVGLAAAAEKYDAVLSLSPRTAFDNLRSAHIALGDALHRRNMTFAEMWPFLQGVFDQTSKFAALAKPIFT